MTSAPSLRPAASPGRVASASRSTGPNVAGPSPYWVEEAPRPTVIKTKPSSDVSIRLKRNQRSLSGRAARSLIIFCIGVAATLAWQSYGGATREMLVSSYPQLGWLMPQIAPAESAPEISAPTAPAISLDSEEIKSILVNLAAVRQSVDELAAQVAAGQQQMANGIAELKAVEQGIFEKISSAPPPRPAAAPPRRPVPPPSQSPQETPAR
jgi:hypothetical protein